MHVYAEAVARYVGFQVDGEVEAALVRVQERHHNRLVDEVVELLHDDDELMDARTQEEL